MLNKKLLFIISSCFILFLGGCGGEKGLPDLRESYSARDTKPFGGKIAYSILQNSFSNNYIRTTKLSFEDGALSSDTSSLYFYVGKTFASNDLETTSLLDYVYNGNTFFLAASYIDTTLLDKLYCKIQNVDRLKSMFSIGEHSYSETSIRLMNDLDSSRYGYYYKPFSNYFSELNDNYCRVLGYNSDEEPNCMVFFWGKGKLFIHTDPRAFSNYFLLKNNNYMYMQQLLQLMNPEPEHIYWNEQYSRSSGNNNSNKSSFSTMDELFKYPPLKAAFWISLLLLLFYVLFGMKRRQRIIKQLQPNQNSSVAFTETIGRLYLQKKDNKNIADKMITYFNEFIRSNYFLYANQGSDDFIQAVSRKSGVSLEKTISLYRAIEHANLSTSLDDYQLLSLNEQIQQFYKKRQ